MISRWLLIFGSLPRETTVYKLMSGQMKKLAGRQPKSFDDICLEFFPNRQVPSRQNMDDDLIFPPRVVRKGAFEYSISTVTFEQICTQQVSP